MSFLFKEVELGNKCVKECAINNFITFLKKNYYTNKTVDSIKKFVAQFSASSSYHTRLAFLQFYEACTKHFSRGFFKQHGLNEVALALNEDKVMEVRKKLLLNLPNIKKMTDPSDKTSLDLVDSILAKFKKDTNKTISMVIFHLFYPG